MSLKERIRLAQAALLDIVEMAPSELMPHAIVGTEVGCQEIPRPAAVASYQLTWMLIPLFCSLTGYTVKAVQRKIADGVFIQGKHYRKAPDDRVTMNLQRYYDWAEGKL